MFMWFSCTKTYRWIACTSSSLVIYWCWTYFHVENVPSILFQSIVLSVRNVLVLGVFGCFSFLINLCELLLPFSCELFQYSLKFTDVDYFSGAKCSYHSPLMLMWFSCTETYRWITCISSSLDIYWFWHIFAWKIFQNFNIAFDYLLMLTIFQNAKCCYHSRLMFMWFSCTETYPSMAHTSSSFGHLLMLINCY